MPSDDLGWGEVPSAVAHGQLADPSQRIAPVWETFRIGGLEGSGDHLERRRPIHSSENEASHLAVLAELRLVVCRPFAQGGWRHGQPVEGRLFEARPYAIGALKGGRPTPDVVLADQDR